MKKIVRYLAIFLCFSPVLVTAKPSQEILKKAEHSTDLGLQYLKRTQDKNGSWSNSVGITALALRSFLGNYRHYSEKNNKFIAKAISYLLKNEHKDGSISENGQNKDYDTAVAITALAMTHNHKYDEVMKRGQDFIKGLVRDEKHGYHKSNKLYGGIGYGNDERPDLSNEYMALEALRATSLNTKDPTWKKALVFISRCQNDSETNDQKWAANDGGFIYMPGYSFHGGTKSYGSMTHAGLISLLFAGADKNDPRVKAAYGWIKKHYSVDKNPGARHNQGLFYYYNVFAKSMSAYGNPIITTSSGVKHNWHNDLINKLVSIQGKNGSWINKYSHRWWEGNRNLVTSWSVIALNIASK